jgi:hypothetical protein
VSKKKRRNMQAHAASVVVVEPMPQPETAPEVPPGAVSRAQFVRAEVASASSTIGRMEIGGARAFLG